MKQVVIFLVTLCLFACQPVISNEPQARPAAVPIAALWVGGADGGVFVEISQNESGYSGTIYTDSTGEIWYHGNFTYSGNSQFDVNSTASYTGWDGEKLYLANGEYLQAE
tara:strand:+ start:14667 stop:14996 length:330 start_codon:yes stop_codon:yes gene_type:complete